MKIRQQGEIRAFLVGEFGSECGGALFAAQEEILHALIGDMRGKTENQRKTLVQTILPRIALRKALQGSDLSGDDANAAMRKYMLDVVAAKKHASTAKLEVIPGFFYVYRKVFLTIMKTTDLQESTVASGKDSYDITITKCLWHTACVENGCPELCPLFCDVDDVTYGGLRKISFRRTQTLGRGGSCCDFHFYRTKGR